jgi:hypothetical protein
LSKPEHPVFSTRIGRTLSVLFGNCRLLSRTLKVMAPFMRGIGFAFDYRNMRNV